MADAFPQWVAPHGTHIVHSGNSVVTARFITNVSRVDGSITVLVANAADAAIAMQDATTIPAGTKTTPISSVLPDRNPVGKIDRGN